MIRMLIVESEEILRVGLQTALSGEGDIQVVGFVSSSREVESDTLDNINVLLIDELIDPHLIKYADDRGIFTVIFSSSSSESDIIDALISGASAYVLKGTSIALLVLAIKAVASGASWLDPAIAKTVLHGLAERRPNRAQPEVKELAGDILSPRETEVLSLLCNGLANKDIAQTLVISGETVKTHVRHIMEKLQVKTRTEAAMYGFKSGLSYESTTTKKFATSS
ncbi:MAG TPA: response regulator transcription factor [Candidatus Obscuribacterales bacterium]